MGEGAGAINRLMRVTVNFLAVLRLKQLQAPNVIKTNLKSFELILFWLSGE